MDRIELELHKLNWRVQILQTIAVDAYATAFSALQTLQSVLPSTEQYAVQTSLERLAAELEEVQDRIYKAFFSDPTVPEEQRALLAEEFAHLVEEIKSSIIPPRIHT